MLTREPTLKEAIDFLELNAYEGSNAITTLRMGDIEEILKPIRKLVNEHFNPQPYKFEDLKVGIWVWENKLKMCVKIRGIIELEEENKKCIDYGFGYVEYKENRLFPITKAMEYQK